MKGFDSAPGCVDETPYPDGDYEPESFKHGGLLMSTGQLALLQDSITKGLAPGINAVQQASVQLHKDYVEIAQRMIDGLGLRPYQEYPASDSMPSPPPRKGQSGPTWNPHAKRGKGGKRK